MAKTGLAEARSRLPSAPPPSPPPPPAARLTARRSDSGEAEVDPASSDCDPYAALWGMRELDARLANEEWEGWPGRTVLPSPAASVGESGPPAPPSLMKEAEAEPSAGLCGERTPPGLPGSSETLSVPMRNRESDAMPLEPAGAAVPPVFGEPDAAPLRAACTSETSRGRSSGADPAMPAQRATSWRRGRSSVMDASLSRVERVKAMP
mmetsp:Transcript_4583/g.19524  ORF Transcript_4583/g.19524 Transcript_4583/m.19524 type:complete len:208 (+) Transcript_4583:1446-2069(+)